MVQIELDIAEEEEEEKYTAGDMQPQHHHQQEDQAVGAQPEPAETTWEESYDTQHHGVAAEYIIEPALVDSHNPTSASIILHIREVEGESLQELLEEAVIIPSESEAILAREEPADAAPSADPSPAFMDDKSPTEPASEPLKPSSNPVEDLAAGHWVGDVFQGLVFLAAIGGSFCVFFRPALSLQRCADLSPKCMLDNYIFPPVICALEVLERVLIRLSGPATAQAVGQQEDEMFFADHEELVDEEEEATYVDQQEELFENSLLIMDRRAVRRSMATPHFDPRGSPLATSTRRRSTRVARRNPPVTEEITEGTYKAVEFLPVRGTPYVQMRHVRRSRRNTLDSALSSNTPMQFSAQQLLRSGSFRSADSSE
jgi:hypothetical protein